MSARLNAPIIDFPMTCDRPCMTQRGLLIQLGTQVAYVERVTNDAVKARMPDDTLEVVRLDCFKQGRALQDFQRRAVRAMARASAVTGTEIMSEIRAAIEALPDTSLTARLASEEARTFIETNLALIKAGE